MRNQANSTPAAPRERYLNSEEAAAVCGFVPAQINKLRLTGQLPAIVVGKKCIRYRESDLHAYMGGKLQGGDGTPAKGSVHPNLTKASRRTPKAPRADHPGAPAVQAHPAPSTPNA